MPPTFSKFDTFYGPLTDFNFSSDKLMGSTPLECGNDLNFLANVRDKQNTFLAIRGDWSQSLPPSNYDTYIITNLGEAADHNWLERINQFPGRKIIITSQHTGDTINSNNTTYFYMEHMHWYTKLSFDWFSKQYRKPLADRQFNFGCLNGRPDWHKEEILKTLLDNYKNLQYTWLEDPINPNYQCKYKIPIQKVDGHGWTSNNHIYNDCKLIWVTESLCDSIDNKLQGYITEKTIKPIVSKCMFIMIGQRLSYARLRGLGFETFEDHFGINWDEEWDFERVEYTKNLIRNFDFDLNQQDLVDYNYDYFYNKFFDVIDKRNTQMKEQILEFING